MEEKLLNFVSPESALLDTAVDISKAASDMAAILKADTGFTKESVTEAAKQMFIDGYYKYSDIVAALYEKTKKKATPWLSLSKDVQDSLLTQRQVKYFSSGLQTSYSMAVSPGYQKFQDLTDADISKDLEKTGLTKEQVLGRLQSLVYAEDEKVALQAVKATLSLMGLDRVSQVQAERKKATDRAAIRLQAKMLERVGGGDALSKFEKAANERYMKRKQLIQNNIEDAKIVE